MKNVGSSFSPISTRWAVFMPPVPSFLRLHDDLDPATPFEWAMTGGRVDHWSEMQDRFGIAWFRYSLTNQLVRVLSNRLALEDEEGLEAFYTVELAKPVRLTASIQVIDSAVTVRDTGVIAGLRLTTRF